MPEPSTWTTVIDDDRGCFKIEANKAHGLFLHLTLKKWNTDVLKTLKDGIAIVTGTLKAVGIEKVHVIIPEGDEKLYRFERLLGFNEARRSGGHILMFREC